MKRVISFALSIVMIICSVICVDFSAQAVQGTDYLTTDDISFIEKEFLYTLNSSEKAMYGDALKKINSDASLTSSDVDYVYNVCSLMQSKLNNVNKFLPSNFGGKDIINNATKTLSYITSAVDLFKDIKYFTEVDSNNIERAYHALDAFSNVCSIFGWSLGPIASVLTASKSTLAIAEILNDSYVQQALAFYENDLVIEYNAGLDYTLPSEVIIDVSNKKLKDGLNALYIKYTLRRMSDEYKKSSDSVPSVDDSGASSNYEMNEERIVASTAEEMKCVPTYVKKDGKVHMLYNPYTAKLAADLSENAYDIKNNKSGVISHLNELGYQQIKIFEDRELTEEDAGNDNNNIFSSLNATIGIKKVSFNGDSKYAIALAFRGSNDLQDWLCHNFDVSETKDGFHKGFLAVAAELYLECENIYFQIDGTRVSLRSIITDMKKENSKYCMLVTGHSLGGAVADCFSGYYMYKDDVYPSNIVTYTFAAPLTAPMNYNYSYDNIFNIISKDDIVPKIGNFDGKQIGKNIYYQPTENFRRTYYHKYSYYESFDDYIPEAQKLIRDAIAGTIDTVSSFIFVFEIAGMAEKLLSMHSMNKVYFDVVNIINEDVNNMGGKYIGVDSTTKLNSIKSNITLNNQTFNRYTDLTIHGVNASSDCDLVVDGDCYVDDGLSINCNLSVGKQLKLGGNNVHFNGDCALGVNANIPVDIPEGRIYDFNGDLLLYGSIPANRSSYGTVNVSGNIFGYNSSKLYANVILDGNKKQTISNFTVSELEFANTSAEGVLLNGTVNVEKYVKSTDCVITNSKYVYLHGTIKGNYYNNSITFYDGAIVNHDVTIDGDVIIVLHGNNTATIFDNQTLTINGNLISNGYIRNNGLINVEQDLESFYPIEMSSDGIINIKGDLTYISPSATTVTTGTYNVAGDVNIPKAVFTGNTTLNVNGTAKQTVNAKTLNNFNIGNASGEYVTIANATKVTGSISSSPSAKISGSTNITLVGGKVHNYYNASLNISAINQTEDATINGYVYPVENSQNETSKITNNSTLNITKTLSYPRHSNYTQVTVDSGSTLNANNIILNPCHTTNRCKCLIINGDVNVNYDVWLGSFAKFTMPNKNSKLNVGNDLYYAPEFGGMEVSTGRIAVGGDLTAYSKEYNNTRLTLSGDSVLELNGTQAQSMDMDSVVNLELNNISTDGITITRVCDITGVLSQKDGNKVINGDNLHILGGKINKKYVGDISLYGTVFDEDTDIVGNVRIARGNYSKDEYLNVVKKGVTLNVTGLTEIDYHSNPTKLIIEKGATFNQNGSFNAHGYYGDAQDIFVYGNLNITGAFLMSDNESPYVSNDGVVRIGSYMTKNYWGISNINSGTFIIGGSLLSYSKTTLKQHIVFGGTSKVILNGKSAQTVTAKDFATLILENPSGTVFEHEVDVKTLFNHNGNPFTLYNNGKGSTFVDYNDDGIKDNVDPYPARIHYFEIVEKVEPTCNRTGSIYCRCTDCGIEKKSTVNKLDGASLSSALNQTDIEINKNCYTEDSIAQLRTVYLLYENALNELNTQADVDNATEELLLAINNLELVESYSGVGANGEVWTWNKSDTSLTISGNVAMADYTASNLPWGEFKNSIKKVVVDDGITRIGNYSFNRYPQLSNVMIGKNVESIGQYAFGYNQGLIEITIPDSVKKIEYAAFEHCYALEDVSVPASVVYYGYAFSNDNAVKNISITYGVDGIMPDCSNSALLINKTTTGAFGPWRYASSASINFNNNIKSIGKNTFYGANCIREITIPESVTDIAAYAFRGCSNLQSIYIPENVTNIGNAAFGNCNSLINIEVDPNNNAYDSRNNCNAIIKTETNELISGCKTTIIPSDIKSIGNYAFYYCNQLKSIDIPNGVERIGSYAFYYCDSLSSIAIPDKVSIIEPYTFYHCIGLSEISFSENIDTVDNYSFYECSNLKSIDIPDRVTSIGAYAFKGCTSLVNMNLPKSINSIGNYVFDGCSSLVDVVVPKTLTSIGSYSFNNCTSLTDIYYLGTQTQWNSINIDANNDVINGVSKHYDCVEQHPKTDHVYESIEGTNIEATCLVAGKQCDQICTLCGYSVEGTTVDILADRKITPNKGVFMHYNSAGSRINSSILSGYISICNDGEDENFTMAYYRFDVTDFVSNKYYVESAPFKVTLRKAALPDCQGLSFYYTGNSNADDFNSTECISGDSSIFGENGNHINKAKDYFDLHEINSFEYDETSWIANYSLSVDIAEAINYSIDNNKNYVVVMIAQPKAGGLNATGLNGETENSWSDVSIKYSNTSVTTVLKKEHLWSDATEAHPKSCLRCNAVLIDFSAYNSALENSIVEETEYTTESYAKYTEMVNLAKIDAETASQAEVDFATTAIIAAKNILVKKNCTVKVCKISDGESVEVVSTIVKYGNVFDIEVDLKENESIYKWTVSTNDRDIKLNTRDSYISQVINGDVEFNCYVDVEPVDTYNTAKVVFYDRANRVIALDYMEIGTAVDVSKISAPRVAFYDFISWDVISGNIENITSEGVSLKAEYRPSRIDANALEIVGLNGVMINGQTSVKAYYDDKLILTGADSFAYCDEDGKIIQGINGSTIYAPNNYVKLYIGPGKSTKASTNINGYNDELPTVTNKGRLTINAQYYLPDGFTIVDAGVVISSTQSNPTIGEAGCTKLASTQQGTGGEYSISLTYSNGKSGTINATSYLIYKDADGLLHTIYSDLKSITFGA